MSGLGSRLLLAVLGSVTALAARGADAPPAPQFKLMRADEDYSHLRDAAADGAQGLKFIPLAASGTVWASLGGDARLRYEWYRNDAWGDGPQDGNGFVSFRTLLHADVHAGENFRVFAQVQSADLHGREGGPRGPDRDTADIHQLFAGWSHRLRGDGRLDLRLGRQEVQYGSGCFISLREGAGSRRSFQGLTAHWQQGSDSVDAFWLRPVEQRPGTWDNKRVHDRLLSGVLWTHTSQGEGASQRLEAYAYHSRNSDSDFAGVAGRERRMTLGGRLLATVGQADASIEMAVQRGRQGPQTVRAWFTAAELGWSPKGVAASPRFALRAGAASGDGNPADNKLGTFNALYPNMRYYGEIAMLGPANLLDLHPYVTLQLGDGLSLTLGTAGFWRHRTAEGVYGPSLQLERAGTAAQSRYVGRQMDAKLAWEPNATTSFELSYAQFQAGPFLRQTGAAKTVRYVNLQGTWRF